MTKLIITGSAGRMGKMLVQAGHNNPNSEIVAGVERQGSPFVGQDCGTVAGIGKLNAPVVDNLEKVIEQGDVVIDFTAPEATMKNVEIAEKYKKKIVIGTTGLTEKHLSIIKEKSKNISIVQAPNMSVGVNLVFKLVEEISQVLSDYDIEIIEAHHNQKKDAPSGTAAKIAEIIADSLNRNLKEVGVYGRQGMVGARKKEEIGIHAVRGGDIVGDHTVLFATNGERIELKHQAHSRMTFAQGAVRAALFLMNQKTGLYSMKEVLGL